MGHLLGVHHGAIVRHYRPNVKVRFTGRLPDPAGKVVIAQGTDPSTLDAMNQLETPAFNVCSQIFEALLTRDEGFRPVPALAQELPRQIAPTVPSRVDTLLCLGSRCRTVNRLKD